MKVVFPPLSTLLLTSVKIGHSGILPRSRLKTTKSLMSSVVFHWLLIQQSQEFILNSGKVAHVFFFVKATRSQSTI
jgi:hypothetical protein